MIVSFYKSSLMYALYYNAMDWTTCGFSVIAKITGNVQGSGTFNVQTKIRTISTHELNKAGGGGSNTNERAGRIEHSALVHLALASISQKMTFATIIATDFQEAIYYVMFLAVNCEPDKGHFSIRNNRPKKVRWPRSKTDSYRFIGHWSNLNNQTVCTYITYKYTNIYQHKNTSTYLARWF